MAVLTCTSCGEVSPAGKRFCADCGAPLPEACVVCGSELIPGKKFCADCGAPVPAPLQGAPRPESASPAPVSSPASPPAAPDALRPNVQEERRLVTALFCDLAGFTPIAEQLDPEEVRDLQFDYFRAMSDQIVRYGGTVEKYAGDAILALFGAPIAHEDDAERAVLCALGMQESIEPVAARARARWHVEPAIRVGVNTGEVVAGTWDVSGRQDVAVTGDALNSAARIQATAEPGEVLVGAETMRLTRRRVRYADRREVMLKGKAAPIPVWPALGVREEFGERWEGYETPLVGRDREMVQLLDAWVRAQGGEGQIVSIVGDAGVGKSRLVAEFLGTISTSAAIRVIRARSLSYGQEISLWLVADLLRSLFGLKEQDTLDAVTTQLSTAIPLLLTDSVASAEALDVIGEALGLPVTESPVSRAGPEVRRHALVRSIRAVMGAVTERAPTVVVLEDLHWMDGASRDVLVEVMADVLGLRTLVVAAQRPGWIAPWSEWGWPERITLRPLGERDAAVLAGAVLGGTRLSPELERYIAERAGGNPFFVEEMLRALQETGELVARDGEMHVVTDAAERLPSTLTEVLLARLDRLDAQVRSIAQVASVIGRSFGVRLLAEVANEMSDALDEPLAQLQRAEIAFPRRTPALEYVFKHISMRDVAYNTLVQKRRAELHLKTARAIAALYAADEYIEMIAYHYLKTDAPEAAQWLERAGDRAAAMFANDEALAHYKEALTRFEQLGGDQRTVARLEEKVGTVQQIAGQYDEALTHLGRAADMARSYRDLDATGRVVALMGMVHRYRGTPKEGIPLVLPAIELLERGGPSESLAALHHSLANLCFVVGRYRDMLAAAKRAADISRAVGSNRLRGEAEERRGVALIILGQPVEGRTALDGAIPLIEASGDLMTLSRALTNVGEAARATGDLKASRTYTERAIDLGERIGNPDRTAFDLANLGDILLTLGEWPAARHALERAMALVGERQVGVGAALPRLGKLALWTGDWEDAETVFTLAIEKALLSGDQQILEGSQACLAELNIQRGRPREAMLQLDPLAQAQDANLGLLLPLLAWAALEAGDIDMAAESAGRAVERTRRQERLSLVDALRVQGMVLARQGRSEEAHAVLAEALSLSGALPYPYAEARVLEQLGNLERSLEIFRRLGARKDIERVQRSLAAST